MAYWLRLGFFIGLSAALQLLFWQNLVLEEAAKKKARPLTIDVMNPPKPEPPPPPPPKPKLKPIDMSKEIEKVKPKEIPPEVLATTPQEEEVEKPAGPPVFGISLSSLAVGPGGFTVPVGNTLQTDPNNRANAEDVRPLNTGHNKNMSAVPAARLTDLPRPAKECKFPYPKEAEEQGVEGEVIILLDIDIDGKVINAKVIKSLSPILDAAALNGIKVCPFRPGMRDGEKVPVTGLRYKYTFVLE